MKAQFLKMVIDEKYSSQYHIKMLFLYHADFFNMLSQSEML